MANAGPDTATNVVLKDLLPTGVTFVSSSDPANYDGASGVWNVGALPVGPTATLTIEATVDQGDPDSTPDSNEPAEDDQDSASITVNALGRMTGGGSVFDEGVRFSHGFTLQCNNADGPNALEINWGKGKKFHLEGLTSAFCRDDPNIDEGKPVAGFNTYIGSGTGRLNGVSGTTITFKFTDAGEPGKGLDLAEFTIGTLPIVTGTLDKGNHQAHPAK